MGRYRLAALIGLGGTAAVYAARDERGRRSAIKLMGGEHAHSARQRQRFAHEARVLGLLSHPSVVQAREQGVAADGAPFLVLELLRGGTLSELSARRGGRIAPEVLLPLVADALLALAEIHAKGIIHRDLKPANLFVSRTGPLKLIDFGAAQAAAFAPSSAHDRDELLVLGTPAFMPPEQARGCWAEIEARSDLWALAATMFTLLSGQPVHGTGTADELLGRAMVMSVRSVADLRPGLSRPLVAFLSRALSFDKADRFPDASTMHATLRSLPEARASRCTSATSARLERSSPPALADTWVIENGVVRASRDPQRSEVAY